MEPFDYELLNPFSYAHKGEMVDAVFITMSAPTSKNMKECADLKQAFYRALPQGDSESVDEKGDSPDIKSDDIMSLITRSKDVELIDVLASACDMFSGKHGVALVDGEERVTRPIIDSISVDDIENMTGEYLARFILASMLRKMKES